MRTYTTFLVFLLTLLSAFRTADSSAYERVLRVSDSKVIPFKQMIEDIKLCGIIFVGESHDSEKHHMAQFDIIKSLEESRVPLAIGLEMFRADNQRDLDLWTTGKLEMNHFLRLYYENWGAPWPWYKNIFLFAKDKGIPMVGLNVPGEISRKVSREGFSSLTGEEMKQLPPGITCDMDAAYMDFMRKVHGDFHKDAKSFRFFCEAQMVWDKTMAWHLLEFLKRNPLRTVVVLAGVGHSWKRGIPEQVRRQSNFRYTVILPEMPGHIGIDTATTDDADYILLDEKALGR